MDFDATSLEESWLLHFTYNHSIIEAVIYLSGTSTPTPFDISKLDLIPTILVVGIFVILGIIIYLSKRKS